MAPTRVILMSCGSYNPPTNMHLRMFEIARDHLHRMGTHIVVGGVISPTHDDYAKKELASSEHRCAMLKLATQNSDWIKISTWESRQNGWTKTRLSLQHHQNLLNSVLLDTNDIKHHTESGETDWIPQNVKNSTDRTPIQIKLLCGADLLESFGTPGLWADEDIDAIVGQHGLVVITREGSNPNKFIYDSDILSKYMHNIHIVTEWIPNEVSSTKIRRALKRGESVRYLVQDSVIEYIYKHGIYDAKTDSTIKLELSSKNDNDYLSIQPKYESTFLTPSPSDVTMTTPSPIEIISIDISESVLKKNYHNTPINSLTNLTKLSEDNDRIREKFNSVISDNVNKILGSNKVAYPGQAKQIIANESGESQIFCEVGLSCISENYKVEMEIDGKVGRVIETDNYPVVPSCSKDMKAIEDRINISNDEIPSESIEPLKTSDQTLTPDDSESKISVILSIDVIDASNVRIREECVKHESPTSSIIQETLIDESLKDSKENVAIEMPEENCHEKSTVALKSEEEKSSLIEDDERSIKIIESESILKTVIHPECSKLQKDEPDVSLIERNVPSTDDVSNSMEKSITGTNERDPSDQDSTTEESIPKREGNIEIDGKYLKSVVNSRKSPKKVKNEVIRSVSSDGSKYSEIKMEKETSSQMEIEESPNSIASMETKDGAMKIVETAGRKRGVVFQGSLDSINVKQPKSLQLNNQDNPSISKKSKSYEFIKPNELQPTKIYKIPLSSLKDGNGTSSCDEASKIKTDSNSIFTTANESQEGGQTDEFCSVCCYANEPESTEAFYTLRSTGSSPLEEALTECDICSNCDLREDPIEEKKTFKQVGPGEPVCELCEICGDAAMDEDVVASSRPEKDDFVDRRLLASRPLPLSLPKRKKGVVGLNARTFSNIDNDDEEDEDEDDVDHFEMDANAATRKITESRDKLHILRANTSEQHSTDDTSSNDDEFEIENCGLDPDLDLDNGNEQNSRYKNEVEDTLRNIVPRDEIALSAKNSKKMTRAGSLISRDNIDRTKGKRRYASVDNLQNSRQIVKTSTTEKPNSLRSRGTGKSLVASADNIRPVRNSRSRTTLRKSADDVGRDSIDDTRESPLYENITRKKFPPKEQQAHKPRDSGYGKTCMPTVRQIVDCLVAARPMPIRCGSCLTAKNTFNQVTNNRSSNIANNCVVITTMANENARVFGNLRNLNANNNSTVETSHRNLQ